MMKKTYLLIALLLPMALGAQEQRYQTLRLAPIDEADTLRFGWIDLLSPHAGQGVALANTYNELIAKREQYRAAQMEVGMAGNDEIAQALNEQDAYWEELRKSYSQMLQQEGLSAEERKEIEQLMADINRYKAESRRQALGQLEFNANEGRESMTGVDPSDFSDERLHLIKNNLRKYVLGGRLWGFSSVRDFRNGFAAVERLDRKGNPVWGFVNRKGEIAIPCTWSGVFNFNNHRPYTLSIYDSPEDEDDRPWTSVTKDGLLGMIDTTGVVRVPVRFDYSNRPQMVFIKTAKGELAAVRDPKTHKWGLIDRSGVWYKPPFSADELEWDSTAGVFYDASGNEIRL